METLIAAYAPAIGAAPCRGHGCTRSEDGGGRPPHYWAQGALTPFSFSIKRATEVGALFNLIIAVPATLGFLQTDRDVPGRPADAPGDVAMFCVATL